VLLDKDGIDHAPTVLLCGIISGKDVLSDAD
jgi:hypothetical protein